MGLIYMVTNIINNKKYIGLTTQTLEKRKSGHYHGAFTKKDNYPFHNALRKYGKENFYWEIIENDIDNKKLSEREQYWIAYYDTYLNGYNATIGGETGIELKIWRKNNPNKAHEAYQDGNKKMKEILKNNPELEEKRKRNAIKGMIEYVKTHEKEWKEQSYNTYLKHKKQVDEQFKEFHKQQSKKVRCVETNIIYESASEAARQNNLSQGNISSVCRGKRKTTGGYHWEYV